MTIRTLTVSPIIVAVCLATIGQAKPITVAKLTPSLLIERTGTRNVPADATIPYTVASRYFVKNTVKKPLENPKIDSRQKFDETFGAAAVMGKNGLPTPIDFSKQYAIAVVVPASNQPMTLTPISLKKDAVGNLIFTYRKQIGSRQTYKSAADLIILVDKKVTGKVILEEKR